MKFDQDLCLNLQYDVGKMNSTLGSVVPLAMIFLKLPMDIGEGGATENVVKSFPLLFLLLKLVQQFCW